jgi:hypothetical protein
MTDILQVRFESTILIVKWSEALCTLLYVTTVMWRGLLL